MQFLFLILMSVLMGASALPHMLQAPNRPSFSLRKNTSFSLVAIPKFFEKMTMLEKKLVALEEQQKKKVLELAAQASSEAASEKEAELVAEVEANEKKEKEFQQNSEQERQIAEYKGPKGRMQIDELELKNCVCQSEGNQSCKVWAEGYCSQIDEYVDLSATIEGVEADSKKLRCKEGNRFSGYINVFGKTTARVSLRFRDQFYQRDIVLTNNCGFGSTIAPPDDE